MAKTAILAIKIIGDAKDAWQAVDKTESKFGSFGKKAGLAVAAGLATAGAAAVALGVSAVQGAGNLEQSIGAIDTVFKDSAKTMHGWAQAAATDVGLTRNEFNELGTLIGTQLKNGGTAMEDLAPKTKNLIELGADLSSMFGGTTADAVGALSSALKGERDPIERFGVSLTQAAIDAKAAELGFSKVGGALSAEANQAATLALIMEQTADAHGNFAKESDTLAHKQQVFAAQVDNLKDRLGTALLPVAIAVFGWLGDTAVPFIEKIVGAFEDFTSEVSGGGLTGALTGLKSVFDVVMGAITPLVPLFMNLVTDGIMPIVTAVAGNLAPLFSMLAGTIFPLVVGAIRSLLPPITSVLASFGELISAIGQRVMPIIKALLPVFKTAFQGAVAIVKAALGVIQAVIRTVTAVVKGDWKGAWNGVKSIFSNVWNLIKTILSSAINTMKAALKAGLSGVVSIVKQLPSMARSALSNIGNVLKDAGKKLIRGFIDGIKNMFGSVKDTLGGLTSKLTSWKGPESLDKKILRSSGQLVIKGFIAGLESQYDKVKRSLAGLTQDVASTTFTPPAIDAPALARRPGDAAAASGRLEQHIHIHVDGNLVDPYGAAQAIEEVLRRRRGLLGVPA